jgi:TetR/AcrR family transcriptional regulator, repressor for uid operon
MFPRQLETMPKLAPKTQHARRERILDAAERCFVSKGFHQATMDDICREASVSPGALYTYFASKEALIAGLCEREIERFNNDLAQVTAVDGVLAALRSLAEKYCCDEPAEKVRLHVEIAAEAGRNPLIGDTVRGMDKVCREGLCQLLETEVKRGAIRPTVPIEVVVRAMYAFGDGLFLSRSLDPDYDPKQMIPAMMIMVEALLAPSQTAAEGSTT